MPNTRHRLLHCALHCVRTNAMQDLIGTTEAVKILGVHPSTVTRWVKSEKLAAVGKLGGPNGALLFRRSDVEALSAANQHTP